VGSIGSVAVTVIGGFLGAGKTTLVNHVLRASPGRRLAVLVNDFGSVDIDSKLVVGVDGDMVSLAGGCICCSIRDDLAQALHRLVALREQPDHILVEASGVSDPAAIARAIADPGLSSVLRLDAVAVVVDAEAHLELRTRERIVANGQLKAADLVVLNKIDLVDDDGRRRVEALVRKVVPKARVLPAERGAVVPELLLGLQRSDPLPPAEMHVHMGDAAAPHHHAEFVAWSWVGATPLSSRRLRRTIDALPPTVFRAKGVVHLAREPTRRGVLHVVGRRAELELGEAWGDAPRLSELVFIGAPGSIDPVALDESLRACERDPNEGSSVTRWVRRLVD
jgi:G3E family GTPase